MKTEERCECRRLTAWHYLMLPDSVFNPGDWLMAGWDEVEFCPCRKYVPAAGPEPVETEE